MRSARGRSRFRRKPKYVGTNLMKDAPKVYRDLRGK
jgi:hypothetical protein